MNIRLKIRRLKSKLQKAGFIVQLGKGSHTFWEHPKHPNLYITISGQDGDDAQRYQEKDVQKLLKQLEKEQ